MTTSTTFLTIYLLLGIYLSHRIHVDNGCTLKPFERTLWVVLAPILYPLTWVVLWSLGLFDE